MVAIKVCGMRENENIQQLVELQPNYIGFIFYSKSKRFVQKNFQLPELPKDIQKVGVFVNEKKEFIKEKIKQYELDCIQLHGDESADFCKEMKEFSTVIKAFGLDKNFDFNQLKNYQSVCDYFLFDTKTSEYGGSGKSFDWNLLKQVKTEVPFFLSGGISLESISEIKFYLDQLPFLYALDVNSRFEIEPGLKNIEKLKILFDEFRTEN